MPSDTSSPPLPSPGPVPAEGIDSGETEDESVPITEHSTAPDCELHAAEIVEPPTLSHRPDPVVQRHVDTPAEVSAPAVPPTVAAPTASAPESMIHSAVAAPQPKSSWPLQRLTAGQELPQEMPAIPAASSTALTGGVRGEIAAPNPAVQRSVQQAVQRSFQRSPVDNAPAESSGAGSTPPLGPGSAQIVKSAPQQPTSLPVVQPISTDVHSESPSVAIPSIPMQSSADVAPPSGRMVLLPPMHRSTDDLEPGRPHLSPESVIADSARPMSLQRMFEHTARTAESSPELPPADLSGHLQAPQTITFDSPVLQREAEAAAPAVEDAGATMPPSAGSAQGAGAGTAGGSALPTNVEELVNRIYDPLAARLRAELWMDRERAGVLMNLHR